MTTGAGDDVASDDPGPVPKRTKVQPTTEGAKGKAAAPPLPRLPPYPKSGDPMDFLKWDKEFRRICALPGTVIPCTVRRKPTGPRTVSVTDVASVADNSMIRKASRSVVGIYSRIPAGKEIMQCSGIVVDWNKISRLATIVTCSAAVCFDGALVHPNPKLLVHLPNRSTAEGQLLFFNAHYRIALLEALVDSPLELANFGSSPKFGQKVFALARDKKSSFFARSGTVLLQDPPFFLKYKYWLSLSSAIELCGTGGPAIDEPIRVARPFLDMDLIAFETLDISHQEEIESEHGITDGFIVDLVCDDSTAGRLGISKGVMSLFHTIDFVISFFIRYKVYGAKQYGEIFISSSRSTFSVLAGVFFRVVIRAGPI
uniref:Uncharacterized protein n=1 Tax=Oryza glumipatula TaxID=40148 RepID=A0A0D9ZUK5_9ORYZ